METQHKICIIKLWYEPILWLLVYLCDFSVCKCKHFNLEIMAERPLYEAALSEQDFKIKWTCGEKAG